jgi:outer membrane lipoprotein-sorting protein
MIQRFSFVSVLFFLLLVGCRTTSTLNLDNRSITSAEVQEIARTHHAHVQSIQGEGRISIETPEIAQSGAFILTLRKPDSVLITLQGPFGIKVGSALVTRTGFSFYNSLENKLITGSASIENLNRILHVQLSFDDLLNIFAGGGFLDDDLRSPDETRTEDGQFVFIYTSHNSSRRYWIEPTSLYIQRIQFLDRSGKLTLEQSFNDFENVDGIEMPYAIRITQPKTQQMLTLKYSDIMVNVEQLQFTFTIPQNAERIRW